MTHLYGFYDTGEIPDAAAAALPAWRRERLEAIHHPTARRQSLCAGLLYVYALKASGIDPHADVDILPAGKPVLRDGGGWFSLSHGGGWALCAVSDRPVGADVEAVRPVKETILRRFHPDERVRFADGFDPGRFFRLWTRKEAWVKAASRDRMRTLSEYNVYAPGCWHFAEYTPADSVCAALCTAEEERVPLTVVSEAELARIFPGV